MDDQDPWGTALTGVPDSVIELAMLCETFSTRVAALADELAKADLSGDDLVLINTCLRKAASSSWLVGAVTFGLERRAPEGRCPHFNVVTTAEWIRLFHGDESARMESYECDLEAGHPGSHVSPVFQVRYAPHPVWIRWSGRDRELVELASCPVDRIGAHPNGVDDEACGLPEGHVGRHWYGDY
ncbi:hypothetical protein [Streptosporangium saharense]|uniref:hypothetical protein n=1 Tax=Streptosporangium saharense TaxID=1706840 RepID=UPI003413F0CA